MRVLVTSLVALTVLPAVALANDRAETTRIENRPYYGATVTIESGVRVFRPLPPHRQVIIAPADGPPVNVQVRQTDNNVRVDGGRD
jgi:hypothetical protein